VEEEQPAGNLRVEKRKRVERGISARSRLGNNNEKYKHPKQYAVW
jgi:hypothetical protein